MRELTWTGLGPGPEIDNLRMRMSVEIKNEGSVI